jgi:hypothetical protein
VVVPVTEHKLFDGAVPFVSTPEFHAHRVRAPHLEQPLHRARLVRAAWYVELAAEWFGVPVTVSDLGCGDGGLLAVLGKLDAVAAAWGYDFAPANPAGWAERDVKAEFADVFGADRDRVKFGEVTVMTEVLEHLADPHAAVRWAFERSRWLVASSPWPESPAAHDECHAWAWDMDGYRALVEQGGWTVRRHEMVDGYFQALLAERDPE